MPLQFQTVEEPSFGRGIDARSAENQIRDGFVRDLVNADVVEGRVRKRKGHADYMGKVPVRVIKYRQDSNTDRLYFTLDSSIDLSRLTGSPLLFYGRSSNVTNDGLNPFYTGADTTLYVPTWFSNITKTFLALTTSTITAPQTEHTFLTDDIFVGISAKKPNTSTTNLTNSALISDISIDPTTLAINAAYTNGTPTSVDTYLFYQDGTPIIGEVYVDDALAVSGTPVTILQSSHGLTSTNIRYQLYKYETSPSPAWVKVTPDSFAIDQTTGDVTLGFGGTYTGTYKVMLATVPQARAVEASVSTISSQVITYDGPGVILPAVDNPYFLYTVYEKNGSTLTEISPDEIWYDDDNDTVELHFSSAAEGKQIRVHYDYGTVRANELYINLPGNINVTATDIAPQMVIYGLDHSTIYGDSKETERRGWVTHLDSYRSPALTHMVAGLGGNLFAALNTDQMYLRDGVTPLSIRNAMPTYYPNLNARVDSGWSLTRSNIGPAFHDAGSDPKRRRAILTFSSGGTNWAVCRAATYEPSTGLTTYEIVTLNPAIVGGSTGLLNEVISTTPGKEDYLTIQGMAYSRHNGTFKVKSCSLFPFQGFATITVENPNLDSIDFNDTGCAGKAGVFTDQIELAITSPFVADDRVLSSSWSREESPLVVSVSTTTLVVGGLYSMLELSPGLTVLGQRTSATIPLRTITNVAASSNIVVGDTITCSDFSRPLQVLYVNVAPDSEGNLQPVPNSITVDESFTWEDNLALPTSLSVAGRWVPIERPTPSVSDTTLPSTVVRYLDSNTYSNQPFLRSAMVQNNLYLTNGNDEVYKYDGSNFYRAGVIPWQPGLFLATETVTGGGINIPGSGSLAVADIRASQLRLTDANAAYFQNGDVVRFTNTEGVNQLLTIDTIVADASATGNKLLSFTDTLSFSALGTSPLLTLVYQAKYAFRLNIRDVNGVIVASAVTGTEDFTALISPSPGKSFRSLLRLVGLPAWDNYDYRNQNIELEVYRTRWTRASLPAVPDFFRIQTIGLTYQVGSGYVDIVDTYSNASLFDTQQDDVVNSLSPSTIPAAWDEPPRAKYLTTADNRLVLANVTDWPTLTMTYFNAGSNTFSDFDNQSFFFKRNHLDTDTTTDMNSRVKYQLRTANHAVDTWPCDCGISGQFKFVSALQSPPVAAKDWVYLYHSTVAAGNSQVVTASSSNNEFSGVQPPIGTIVHFTSTGTYPTYLIDGSPVSISPNRGYFVSGSSGSNKFYIAETRGGISLDLATDGTGVLTVLWDGSELNYAGWYQISAVDNITTTVAASVTASNTITISGGDASRFPTSGAFIHNSITYNYTGKTGPVAGVYTLNNVSPTITATLGDTLTLDGVRRYTAQAAGSNLTTIPTQFPDKALFASNNGDVPVLLGIDGNLGMSNGNTALPWTAVIRRLGKAINATMRLTDTTLAGQTNFVPWLMARSESDVENLLYIKQPRTETTTVSLTLGGSGPARYVNGSLPSPDPTTPVKAVTTRYPSRILASYRNYPEIFDNPWTVDTDRSDSAIDVNSADGQEITGIIPFFGESAFGASQKAGVLVVFKQNSIYLVDLAAKAAGLTAVQRLETQGLGCTAPYSIAPTKDGIAFANDSGIYVLRYNQRIEYLGRFVERLWQNGVRKDFLDIVQGHHYGVGRQYKLSVPIKNTGSADYAANSQVYVYGHTGETAEEGGGWSRYTDIPATGWANLFQDAFYGSVNGSILRLRNLGGVEDYRDGSAAIEAILETRAIGFGNTAIRKIVSHVTVHYRSETNTLPEKVTLETAPDLSREYYESTSFRVITNPGTNDGLSNVAGQDIVSIMHTIGRRRCIYIAVKITSNGKDENVEIAGLSYTVAGLSGAGVKQAAETE